MIDFLVRAAFIFLGVATLADIYYPKTVETGVIERHQTSTSSNQDSKGRNLPDTTTYTLVLSGTNVRSCDVGPVTFNALRDNDPVEVHATRVLKHCTLLSRGHDVLQAESRQWEIVGAIIALALIAIGLGLLKLPADSSND